MRHGEGPPLTVKEQVWLAFSDDPRLALVHADMGAWLAEHPCTCEAGCECEAGGTCEDCEVRPCVCEEQ